MNNSNTTTRGYMLVQTQNPKINQIKSNPQSHLKHFKTTSQ